MKLILLDYDGTYTEFPELIQMIINRRHQLGYEVIMATMRYESEKDAELEKIEKEIKVIYTERKAKLSFLEDNYNIIPDLVIDDNPKWLFING